MFIHGLVHRFSRSVPPTLWRSFTTQKYSTRCVIRLSPFFLVLPGVFVLNYFDPDCCVLCQDSSLDPAHGLPLSLASTMVPHTHPDASFAERPLRSSGCIVSASLAVMGLVRIVQNWSNPIEGYQPGTPFSPPLSPVYVEGGGSVGVCIIPPLTHEGLMPRGGGRDPVCAFRRVD